jgi:hypothetical protein
MAETEQRKANVEVDKDQPKLGTKVTYVDPDREKVPVTMKGGIGGTDVMFVPGEATDLAEFMPKERAETMARKLAGNRYFQVEGGPDHEKERQQAEQRRREQEERKREIEQEQEQKMSPERRRKREAQMPPDYKPPDEARLENETPAQKRRRERQEAEQE